MFIFLCKAIATGLFLSYIPPYFLKRSHHTGAGLLGTLLGLFLLPLTPESPVFFLLFLSVSIAAAVFVSSVAGRALGMKDDPRIIIDETVGFWTSSAFLPRDPWHLLAAFILFRLFDVLKPFPIKKLEDLPEGWGVVLDDVAAGAFACLLVHIGDWLLRLF